MTVASAWGTDLSPDESYRAPALPPSTILHSAVDAELDKWLRTEHRIGLRQFRILGHLRAAPDRRLRINDLAELLGLNQSSISRTMDRLEYGLLARRDPATTDRRGVFAVLAPRGDELLDRIQRPYEAELRSLLEDLETSFPPVDPPDSYTAPRTPRRINPPHRRAVTHVPGVPDE